MLIEPEDNSIVENYLQEIMSTYKNIGESYACSVLLLKGIKIKRQCLKLFLNALN